eukprot:2984210-Prymnesium_polylepis.2
MSTVGYGDYTPQTLVGRLLTGFAMIAGLIVISMALSLVGSNFAEAWESRTLALIAERLKKVTEAEHIRMTGKKPRLSILGRMAPSQVRQQAMITPEMRAFQLFDEKREGVFTYRIFKRIIQDVLNLHLSNFRIRQAWRVMDADDSNNVDFIEFASALYPELDEDDLASALNALTYKGTSHKSARETTTKPVMLSVVDAAMKASKQASSESPSMRSQGAASKAYAVSGTDRSTATENSTALCEPSKLPQSVVEEQTEVRDFHDNSDSVSVRKDTAKGEPKPAVDLSAVTAQLGRIEQEQTTTKEQLKTAHERIVDVEYRLKTMMEMQEKILEAVSARV